MRWRRARDLSLRTGCSSARAGSRLAGNRNLRKSCHPGSVPDYGVPATVALTTSWKPAVSAAWTWTSENKSMGASTTGPSVTQDLLLSEEAMFPNLEELVRIIIKSDALENWTR
ncbi:hypothetical protein R6Z07M_001474 [Ovis aries]